VQTSPVSNVQPQVIGVVGAGAMGRGIVQLFAAAGHRVFLFDTVAGAAVKGRAFVADMIQRTVDKGRRTADEAREALERIGCCTLLTDLAPCDIVIEAIVEDITIKQQLFTELEECVSDHTILASNTSSLVIAEIAAKCKRPERVAGLHFFNPVPLMKVVEVIAAVKTSADTVARLRALVEHTGHRAVVAADQPGFLVNHAGRGLYTEGLRVVEDQVATAAEVDVLMREAAGFRMGPFELMDLTGLDVSGRVMTSIYEQFQHEPRFRPSSLVPPRIAAGLYGRKSSEGWYRYDREGKPIVVTNVAPFGAIPQSLRIWIDPDAQQREGLATIATNAGANLVTTSESADLLIIQPWGWDATSYCVEHGLAAARCVAIDPLPGLKARRTLMMTAITEPSARDLSLALFSRDGAQVTLINDSPGFVVQRVLATIVNIAANIAQRGIASVPDIEDAVKLGLGYPHGPLSWGDRLGGARVLSILRNMHAITGDPRYRPSLWLQRRVALGVSLLTPEVRRT